jgi:hypothetical protein
LAATCSGRRLDAAAPRAAAALYLALRRAARLDTLDQSRLAPLWAATAPRRRALCVVPFVAPGEAVEALAPLAAAVAGSAAAHLARDVLPSRPWRMTPLSSAMSSRAVHLDRRFRGCGSRTAGTASGSEACDGTWTSTCFVSSDFASGERTGETLIVVHKERKQSRVVGRPGHELRRRVAKHCEMLKRSPQNLRGQHNHDAESDRGLRKTALALGEISGYLRLEMSCSDTAYREARY